MRTALDNLGPGAIIPPLTTPFDSGGDLDLEGLGRNLERYERAGLGGYLVFGSNGEAVHLDAAERFRVLTTVRHTLGAGRFVLAGVNALSTRAAIEQVARAADAGADAALVVTPYFYQGAMSQDVLRAFYTDLADVSPIPLLIYNIPQNTGLRVQPATLAALAGHQRIAGTKDSSGDFGVLAETLRLVPAGFRVFVGNAALLHPALTAGASGAIVAAACAVPEACVALARSVIDGDVQRARALQCKLAPLGRLLTAELGIAGLKAALEIAGLTGGLPRLPLQPLPPGARAQVAAALEASGLVEAER